MVPPEFANFFIAVAGVGATLFGLIFLVISIKPESTITNDAPIMQQVQAASAYSSLLNPLVISLMALIPHNTIGNITLTMSLISFVNTLIMSLSLFKGSLRLMERLRRVIFCVGSFVLFGFEIFYAIRLLQTPADSSIVYTLASLFVVIYIYGVARAWDLVGARQFHIYDVFMPGSQKKDEKSS